jgi:hypothetical protein
MKITTEESSACEKGIINDYDANPFQDYKYTHMFMHEPRNFCLQA